MEVLYKILQVIFLLGFIYLLNRFIVRYMITYITGFHKRNNQKNLNRQPLKFLIDNEENIYKIYCVYFWFGALVISYGILFN